jgi:PAS domain S-box-containing protein
MGEGSATDADRSAGRDDWSRTGERAAAFEAGPHSTGVPTGVLRAMLDASFDPSAVLRVEGDALRLTYVNAAAGCSASPLETFRTGDRISPDLPGNIDPLLVRQWLGAVESQTPAQWFAYPAGAASLHLRAAPFPGGLVLTWRTAAGSLSPDNAADRQAGERLQAALSATGTGTYRWDFRTDAVEFDSNLDRLFDLPPGQTIAVLGDLRELVHPDDVPGLLERCEHCRLTGAAFDMEYRVLHRDGSVHWLDDKGQCFHDANGRPLYMMGACVDITARKQQELALREGESRFRALAEAMPQIVWMTDAQGQVDYYNARWGLYTGVPAEQALRQDWREALHPDDTRHAYIAWSDSVRDGTPYETEYRLRRHDGVYRWQLARGLPVHDVNGTVTRWFGTCTDIHDQKLAEERARASERLSRTLFEALPSIAWVNHADGRLHYFNSLWTRYTGLTTHPASYDAWMCAFHPDDVKLAIAARQPAIARGEAYSVDLRLRRASDGAYRWHNFRVTPLRNEAGELFAWLGTASDIDELRGARDEAERAGRSKDEFLAALSHELRTPLTPVLLTAQVLERDPSVPEHVRADLRMIRRNVGIETRLIDDLLDLTRISRGKVQLHREAVDIHDIVAHAAETCRDDAYAQKQLALEQDFHAEQRFVSADPARLGQVFWNLLKNAVKFTPAGGSIRVRTWNPAPDRIAASVIDTGVGIDPAVLPLVFDAFEQGGANVTRQFGGLGLGLAICKAITELHGGTITAHSDGPGHGATFTVEFPTTEPPLPKPVEAPSAELLHTLGGSTTTALALIDAPPVRLTPPRGKAAILLVEDHESTGLVMRRLLTAVGYEVEWAATAAAAADLAGRRRFDLVVSDLGLPDGTGHDLMRELRQVHGLRGIALSGFGMDHDISRGRAAGFVRHLVKPVTVETLDAAIQQVLVQ